MSGKRRKEGERVGLKSAAPVRKSAGAAGTGVYERLRRVKSDERAMPA